MTGTFHKFTEGLFDLDQKELNSVDFAAAKSAGPA
jgi:hypothetical protein